MKVGKKREILHKTWSSGSDWTKPNTGSKEREGETAADIANTKKGEDQKQNWHNVMAGIFSGVKTALP